MTLSQSQIEKVRRKAAENASAEFQRAFRLLRDQDNQIGELRGALERKGKGISGDINELSLYLGQIQENAATLLDGDLPPKVAEPLKWAKGILSDLRLQIDQARALASKLIALEIDKAQLANREQRLRANANGQLRTSTDLATSWKVLRDVRETWNEGLDFISGLCVRRAGLDSGLCQIADAIISEVRWTGVDAIAVPGRGGSGFLAQIVHLRFPEWSIWALPLTAHEIWHLGLHDAGEFGGATTASLQVLESILEEYTGFEGCDPEEIRQQSTILWGDPAFHLCLADAFGTFSMGPAYAYACIWLALDPTDEVSQQRALSILKVLESVPDYDYLRKDLEQLWHEVSSSQSNFHYAKWIEAQLKYLRLLPALEFSVERWKELRRSLTEAMRTGDVGGISLSKLQVRYVVSAAWKARTEYPDKSETISRACIDLCTRIVRRSGQQASTAEPLLTGF